MSEISIKSDPTDWVEFVLERFVYNYKSDTVHWKSIYSEDGCGSVISGSTDADGYKNLRILGPKQKLHRVVWILKTGGLPLGTLDHIDGDRSNNAHWNLRDVSHSANCHNRKAKGYHWIKRDKLWQARIWVDYKYINLGRFNTEDEARAAYEAAKKLHGFIHR